MSTDNPSASSKISEKQKCKKVRQNNQTCTICKNPKTGGNSKKCYYEYQPPEKHYKFTKSKSFGYDDDDEEEDDEPNEKSESRPRPKTAKQKVKPVKESYEAEESEEDDFYPSASYSEFDDDTEKVAETKSGNCKQVRKDSMTCTICKDPRTGGNSENCAYSYEPDDKVFAYTKSKSFGQAQDEANEDSGEEDDEEGASESFQRRSDDVANEEYSAETPDRKEFESWQPLVKYF